MFFIKKKKNNHYEGEISGKADEEKGIGCWADMSCQADAWSASPCSAPLNAASCCGDTGSKQPCGSPFCPQPPIPPECCPQPPCPPECCPQPPIPPECCPQPPIPPECCPQPPNPPECCPQPPNPPECCPQPPCPPVPCPCPPQPDPVEAPDFYAQFGVMANPESGSGLPFIQIFNEGEKIFLENSTTIFLPAGYLYLIDYIFLATPEADSYMEIVPELNGTFRALYSFFAPTGRERNTSASGSFTTNEAAAQPLRLRFHLTYPAVVRNIDISGAVSITPLQKLNVT